ncbi:MAG TPA: hypothetical protein VK583_09670, partial [Burkholderiales bacterium]|nr:hypothetical protein [Burkholderiales bacterium]
MSAPFRGANRPYPWEQDMTVCIAALCEDFKTIVTASDKMISNDFVARESGLTKFAHITEKWAFSFSASDV